MLLCHRMLFYFTGYGGFVTVPNSQIRLHLRYECVKRKHMHVYRLVLSEGSGVHCGSWNVPLQIKRDSCACRKYFHGESGH